jgi:hypothetical protein
MSEITVANTDWSIVQAIKTALGDAAVDSAAVFRSVTVAASDAQSAECQFRDSPIAILRYVTTREDESPEGVRGCCVVLELVLAAMVECAATDESSRLQEVLRLKNAAINAVETDAPADSSAWGDGDHYHKRIQWGRPQIDMTVRQPWAVCRLPLEVGYVLDNGTSH